MTSIDQFSMRVFADPVRPSVLSFHTCCVPSCLSGVDETLLAPTEAPRRVTKLMKARRSRSVQKLLNCGSEYGETVVAFGRCEARYQIELPH